MNYVFSTATCGTDYHIYADSGNRDVAIVKKKISIAGGHGLANKNLVTAKGVMTAISDEDLALLEKDVHFQNHVKAGFVCVEKRKAEPEKVAANMEDRDGSAPVIPKNFESGEHSDSGMKTYKIKGRK
jgi:hypothetical protein